MLGDHTCYEFCHNDVFVWDAVNERPIVQNPLNCVLGCESCAPLCPTEAITFPNKDELRATLKRLRAEIRNEEEAAQIGRNGEAHPSEPNVNRPPIHAVQQLPQTKDAE